MKTKIKRAKLTAYSQEEDTSVFDFTVFAPNQHCAPEYAERRRYECPKAALSGPLTRVCDADGPDGGEDVRWDSKELGLDLGVPHAGQ